MSNFALVTHISADRDDYKLELLKDTLAVYSPSVRLYVTADKGVDVSDYYDVSEYVENRSGTHVLPLQFYIDHEVDACAYVDVNSIIGNDITKVFQYIMKFGLVLPVESVLVKGSVGEHFYGISRYYMENNDIKYVGQIVEDDYLVLPVKYCMKPEVKYAWKLSQKEISTIKSGCERVAIFTYIMPFNPFVDYVGLSPISLQFPYNKILHLLDLCGIDNDKLENILKTNEKVNKFNSMM